MKKVTLWKIIDQVHNKWTVDHIEEGWVEGERPLLNPDKHQNWKKEFAYKDELGRISQGYVDKKYYYE